MSYSDEYEIIASIPGKRTKSFRARYKKTGRYVLIHLLDSMLEFALSALPAPKRASILETQHITGGLVMITDANVTLPIEDWLIDPAAAGKTEQLLNRGKWDISQLGFASQPEIQVAEEGSGTVPKAPANLNSISSAIRPTMEGRSVPLNFSPDANAPGPSPSLIADPSGPVAAPAGDFTSKFMLSGTGPSANTPDESIPPMHLFEGGEPRKIHPGTANSKPGVPGVSPNLDSAPPGEFTRMFHSWPVERSHEERPMVHDPPVGNFTQMIEGNTVSEVSNGDFTWGRGPETRSELESRPNPAQSKGDFTRFFDAPFLDQPNSEQPEVPPASSLEQIQPEFQKSQISQAPATEARKPLDTTPPKPNNYLPLVFIVSGLVIVAIAILIYFAIR